MSLTRGAVSGMSIGLLASIIRLIRVSKERVCGFGVFNLSEDGNRGLHLGVLVGVAVFLNFSSRHLF